MTMLGKRKAKYTETSRQNNARRTAKQGAQRKFNMGQQSERQKTKHVLRASNASGETEWRNKVRGENSILKNRVCARDIERMR